MSELSLEEALEMAEDYAISLADRDRRILRDVATARALQIATSGIESMGWSGSEWFQQVGLGVAEIQAASEDNDPDTFRVAAIATMAFLLGMVSSLDERVEPPTEQSPEDITALGHAIIDAKYGLSDEPARFVADADGEVEEHEPENDTQGFGFVTPEDRDEMFRDDSASSGYGFGA